MFGNYYQPYQPMMYQQPMQDNLSQLRQNYQPPHQNTDERIWVQGEDAAKAYLMTPNSFVRLWDSNINQFYEKRTDATGRPFMESYTYTKNAENTIQNNKTEEGFNDKLKALEDRISALEKRGHDAEPNAND